MEKQITFDTIKLQMRLSHCLSDYIGVPEQEVARRLKDSVEHDLETNIFGQCKQQDYEVSFFEPDGLWAAIKQNLPTWLSKRLGRVALKKTTKKISFNHYEIFPVARKANIDGRVMFSLGPYDFKSKQETMEQELHRHMEEAMPDVDSITKKRAIEVLKSYMRKN